MADATSDELQHLEQKRRTLGLDPAEERRRSVLAGEAARRAVGADVRSMMAQGKLGLTGRPLVIPARRPLAPPAPAPQHDPASTSAPASSPSPSPSPSPGAVAAPQPQPQQRASRDPEASPGYSLAADDFGTSWPARAAPASPRELGSAPEEPPCAWTDSGVPGTAAPPETSLLGLFEELPSFSQEGAGTFGALLAAEAARGREPARPAEPTRSPELAQARPGVTLVGYPRQALAGASPEPAQASPGVTLVGYPRQALTGARGTAAPPAPPPASAPPRRRFAFTPLRPTVAAPPLGLVPFEALPPLAAPEPSPSVEATAVWGLAPAPPPPPPSPEPAVAHAPESLDLLEGEDLELIDEVPALAPGAPGEQLLAAPAPPPGPPPLPPVTRPAVAAPAALAVPAEAAVSPFAPVTDGGGAPAVTAPAEASFEFPTGAGQAEPSTSAQPASLAAPPRVPGTFRVVVHTSDGQVKRGVVEDSRSLHAGHRPRTAARAGDLAPPGVGGEGDLLHAAAGGTSGPDRGPAGAGHLPRRAAGGGLQPRLRAGAAGLLRGAGRHRHPHRADLDLPELGAAGGGGLNQFIQRGGSCFFTTLRWRARRRARRS